VKLAGIDYSTTTPCVCIFKGEVFNHGSCRFYFLTNTKKYVGSFFHDRIHGEEYASHVFDDPICRYEFISDWALRKLENVDHVLLEGYAMGAKGMVFNIAENTGLLKYKMWRSSLSYDIAAPTTLKKFAIKGNASKDEMYETFVQETNINLRQQMDYSAKKISSPIGDIVDSYYACKYAYETYHEERNEGDN
jgi:hypothetical protein